MAFSKDFMKKVEHALTNQLPATRESLLNRYSMDITVRSDGTGYYNPRVTHIIDRSVSFPVRHLQFIPMHEEGCIVAQVCDPEAPGAEEVSRSDSQRTFTVNMKAALQGFVSELPEDRKVKYKVSKATVELDGAPRSILVVQVKEQQSRKVKARSKVKKGKTATSSSPASSAKSATPEAPATDGTAESAS